MRAILPMDVIRAVAFDLDDTLAVTVEDRKTLLRRAADRADVPLSFDREDYLEAHDEHSGAESRKPVFEALVDSDASALTDAYREAIGKALQPVDDAAATLADLGSGYRVGVLTDGPDRTQRDKLQRLGWSDDFDVVVVTGPLDAPKPNGRAFAALVDGLDVAPEETVYVGDHPVRDIAGAAAAGLHPIQITYENGPPAHPEAVATVQRSEFHRLRAVVESLGDGSNDP